MHIGSELLMATVLFAIVYILLAVALVVLHVACVLVHLRPQAVAEQPTR